MPEIPSAAVTNVSISPPLVLQKAEISRPRTVCLFGHPRALHVYGFHFLCIQATNSVSKSFHTAVDTSYSVLQREREVLTKL